jgi:hypothetical protein
MSKISDLIGQLETNLVAAKEVAGEFESGKKAAAGKLRKEAQTAKGLWQQVRIETMNVLKAMPTKTRVPKTETPA